MSWDEYWDDEEDEDDQGKLPFVAGSDTSKEAAKSSKELARRLRQLIYRAISKSEDRGYICDEIEIEFTIPHQSASPRFGELAERGMIRDSGERRKTKSKRNAAVWVAVPEEEWAEQAAAYQEAQKADRLLKAILKEYRVYASQLPLEKQEALLTRIKAKNASLTTTQLPFRHGALGKSESLDRTKGLLCDLQNAAKQWLGQKRKVSKS